MRIVFFGSSEFAVPALKALISAGHQISCVVTQPDRPKGRGLSLESTAVKNIALQAGLEVYQPSAVNTMQAIKFIREKSADLFAVVSYGQILSQELLDAASIFALNAHASLLPKYRGAAPINWAIINGEKTTGVTIMRMAPKMDAGPVLASESINILGEDDAVTLSEKLSVLAADLLKESIVTVSGNKYRLSDQQEDQATFAPKLKKEDGLINWDKSAGEIHNLVRGCSGWPGAFSYYKGKILKIYKAGVCRSAGLPVCRLPGEIIKVDRDGITVAAGEENLIIEELQLEGKRRIRVEEFISGHKIIVGERLDYSAHT